MLVQTAVACSVEDFNYQAYDDYISSWTDYLYPYKLHDYAHEILSDPQCVVEIDYSSGYFLDAEGNTTHTCSRIISMQLNSEALSCDALAIWVDYSFTADVQHMHCTNGEFPSYVTCLLKFLPPVDANHTVLSVQVGIADDETDFSFMIL